MSEIKKCRVCTSEDMEYDEELFRYVCNRCNTMEEMSGYCVVTPTYEKNWWLRGSFRLHSKMHVSHKQKEKNRKGRMQPFSIQDMFSWIFSEQVKAMRPWVPDFEEFWAMAVVLWKTYLRNTGCDFDIARASLDDFKVQDFPLGWGPMLNPKMGVESILRLPEDYLRLRKFGRIERKKDIKNQKQIIIDKAVRLKMKEKMPEKPEKPEEMDEEFEYENQEYEEKESQISEDTVKFLSDDDDQDYIEWYDLNEKEENRAKILRKRAKKVIYTGGKSRNRHLLMENNIMLLYFCLYLTRKNTDCYCLADVLKLVRNGTIPYLKIGTILPSEKYFFNDTIFQSMLLRDNVPSYQNMKQYGYYLAETIQLDTMLKVDLEPLLTRMVKQLNLPSDLGRVIAYVRSVVEPLMERNLSKHTKNGVIDLEGKINSFKRDMQYILFYEVHCLACIFTAMRMLLRIDGTFEFNISRLATRLEKAGVVGGDPKKTMPYRMFIWERWLQQMHVPPSIASTNTWQEIERRPHFKTFVEETAVSQSKMKRLEDREMVNAAGRFVQKSKPGTHQDTFDRFNRHFKSILNGLVAPDRTPEDMTDTSIYYLTEPTYHLRNVSKRPPPDVGEDFMPTLEKMSRLLDARPMAYRRLPDDSLKFPRGVFEDVLAECGLTSSEEALVAILAQTFGVDEETLHVAATIIDKALK